MECCRDVYCLRMLVGREESIGMKYRGTTIVQWDNRLQNGIGCSKLLFSVILKALHPALAGLTAGWLSVRQTN